MAEIRLQKLLADRGVASRRSAAALIRAGRVNVSGTRIIEPGHRVDSMSAEIAVDGTHLPPHSGKKRTIMLHKPRGYICSTKSQSAASSTVYELLSDIEARLAIGGRLDKESEGLVLMSDDGDLIHHVSHPRFLHNKTYLVLVSGEISQSLLAKLRSPLSIDGYMIRRSKVRIKRREGTRSELEFILSEGRNRQIRKMCSIVGLRVHRIKRISMGDLKLGDLGAGQWRDLRPAEVSALSRSATAQGVTRRPNRS